MIDKEEAIKKLRVAFSKYPEPVEVFGSPISVGKDANSLLTSRPFRSWSDDDWKEYQFKAMSTWGTEENYKYFLPKILDESFYSLGPWGSDIFFGKILSAGCHEEDEQNALQEYMLAMWKDASDFQWIDLTRIIALTEYLPLFTSNKKVDRLFTDWAQKWVEHTSEEVFEKLVNYINYNWVEVLYKGEPHFSFLDIVLESSFQERLQNAFFEYEQSRPQFAKIISSCEKYISDYLATR